MKDHLEKQIPELVAQLVHVIPLDGLGDLVRLLQGVGQDAAKALLQVPGAAPVGIPEPGHDGEKVVDGCGISHGGSTRLGPGSGIRVCKLQEDLAIGNGICPRIRCLSGEVP